MRNGQNKRMRGRNRRGHNPLTRVYESNGPDVKIRGTAHHIAEKYVQLARDAQSSGDPVAAEGYLQHAEHYFRLIAAAQAQFAQQNPQHHQPQQHQHQQYQRPDLEPRDDFEDDGDDLDPPQPFPNAGPQAQRPQPQPQPPQPQPQPNFQGYPQRREEESRDGGLPAFITGGANAQPGPNPGNGFDGDSMDRGDRGDRFGRRRRRFRPRGPHDFEPRAAAGGEMPSEAAPGPSEPSGEPQKTGD
jgi:hypothetical protein